LNQFKRVANVYFLVISVLMLIGNYAPQVFTTPLDPYSTIVTFVIVLGVTCVKEGIEDMDRYKSDKFENEKIVKVCTFENGQYVEKGIETQFIKGGDIIKLEGKQAVPADMMLLMTSNWDDGNQCYIETANIDGETNLKLKNAPADLSPLCSTGKATSELFRGEVEFEPPNKSIYTFGGAYRCKAIEHPIALGPENVLLRSSIFSNTDWGYGVALYTGQETKIQMNNRESASKMSNIEHLANRAIEMVFCAQVILCSITVVSIYFMGLDDTAKMPYVYPTGDTSTSELPLWLEMWFIFFLLFNNFIPISLYVTIELVNLGQSQLINTDEKMYDEKLDLTCSVKSSNLAQELGMVSNIFSDKTGTLTCNEMEFVKFYVDGTLYDVDPKSGSTYTGACLPGTHLPQNDKIYDFVRCLTTCHTVIREKDGTYRAESPDELAFVLGANALNCSVIERGSVHMSVSIFGERQEYDVLAVNAFNSERKRMSVLMKNDKGEYFLMCKGADNVMFPLCNLDDSEKTELEKELIDFAVMGLRTLFIGQKRVNTAVAEKWLKDHADAASSMEDRAAKLDKIAAELEMGMELLGITAIEDKLQDEVPEVIADLAKAGIVLWMLTGDKEETAINIGRSCNLVLTDTKLFMLTGIKGSTPHKEGAKLYHDKLKSIHDDIVSHWVEGDDPTTSGYRDDSGRFVSIVFVLDGPSFGFYDKDNAEQTEMFLYVGKCVRSVISCRLTPNQKESVVHLVKVNTVPKATCLAIGDGANDVSMILEGDVGVGIFGKEGRQAANNADFAIGQFKFLKRLLLVHGRWNYIRQAKVFLYSLHKNAVITMLLFWFCYFTGLSGTSPFQSYVYSGYNLVLGLPIVFFGIMDRDLSQEFVEANPQVYETGQKNSLLGPYAVVEWTLNAIGYAIILCLILYYAVSASFADQSLYIAGTSIYVALIMAMQGKVVFLHHQWAWPQTFVMGLSFLGMFFMIYVAQYFSYDDLYGAVGPVLFADETFWFMALFSVPIIMLLFEGLCYWVQLLFYPTKEMLYREIFLKVSSDNNDANAKDGLGLEGGEGGAGDTTSLTVGTEGKAASPVVPPSPTSPSRIDQPLL
jgi:phospholipid-transporting ATPase